jgi:hypothetical protein
VPVPTVIVPVTDTGLSEVLVSVMPVLVVVEMVLGIGSSTERDLVHRSR